MSDYISREAALEAVCADCSEKMRSLCELDSNHCKKYNAVKSVPPADVRPVIPAKWIALDIYRSEGNYKCSNCGQPCYVPECMGEPMYSVCPNCGAKMGGTP